jgi:hypothetical protein
MGENKTISVNIKDAFSDQVYHNVEMKINSTVRQVINGLAEQLGLALVNEDMSERTFALKRINPEVRLQSDQVISKVVQEGETIEFYEETSAGALESHREMTNPLSR